MSLIPFRCGLGEATPNATSALCLNGGLCQVEPDTGRQYCECPTGFVNDYTVGHFPNCGLPYYALAIVAGVVVSLSLIALLVSVPIYREVERKVKSLVGLWILVTILNMSMVIALWAEQGAFRGYIVCLLLFVLVVYRNIKAWILTFAGSVYALIKRDMTWFQNMLMGMEVVNAVGQVLAIIPLLIFARDEDTGRFNTALVVYLFLFAFGLIATTSFMVFQTLGLKRSVSHLTRALNASLDSSNGTQDRLMNFQKRLHMIVLLNMSMSSTATLLLVFPIVYLAVGSFPGQYILLSFFHVFMPIFCIISAVILRRQKDDPSGDIPGRISSKHNLLDSKVVVASLHAGSTA
jgi:hypothetical protein